MYFDFLVKIPENTGKISLNKRGSTTYIEYNYGRRYVPEKEYIQKKTTESRFSTIPLRITQYQHRSALL